MTGAVLLDILINATMVNSLFAATVKTIVKPV
jgi:hypothetical protein